MADDERSITDVERIAEIRREIERAENAGDPSFIDEYATEDIVAMPPGQQPNIGKAAGKENLRDRFATFDVRVDYTSEEIIVGEEFAFDRGTATATHVPKNGGEALERTSNYLWLYRRTSDGDWKQFRVIYNTSE